MYKTVDLSKNEKTGPMSAVYVGKDSCPISCALYRTCYAKQGHTNIHFDAANSNGKNFAELLDWVSTLPLRMWRYGVTGDLPGDGKSLCRDSILKLAKANKRRPVLAYSHYPVTTENLTTLKAAREDGFVVNASCDTLEDIKAARAAKVPAVTYTSSDDKRKAWTDDGLRFVTCPNQSTPTKPTCKECKLCSKGERDFVIVFRAHGSAKGKVSGVV